MTSTSDEPRPKNDDLLRISELAERAEVPVATVRHYLREGLLPEPVKTSRNMAYYPPEFVDRIRLIKQLQEERFMPLRVIRDLLEREDAEPERLRAMIELEDRILDRALAGERERVPAAEVEARYDVPREVLERMARGRRADAGRRRLLAFGRAGDRGDRALSRRRLRREPRVHRLRHAALQAGARAAGRRGGQGADRAARGRPRSRARPGDRRGGDRPPQRPDRRAAHQAARRAAGGAIRRRR